MDTTYRYKIIDGGDFGSFAAIEHMLNEMGSNGWRVISTVGVNREIVWTLEWTED